MLGVSSCSAPQEAEIKDSPPDTAASFAQEFTSEFSGRPELSGIAVYEETATVTIAWSGVPEPDVLDFRSAHRSDLDIRFVDSLYSSSELAEAIDALTDWMIAVNDSADEDSVIITRILPLPDGAGLLVGFDGADDASASVRSIAESIAGVNVVAAPLGPLVGQQ